MQFLFVINQHNIVGADIIRPRSLHKFIDSHLVGCGDSSHRCRDSGMNFFENLVLQTVGANFVRPSKICTKFKPHTL